MPFDKVIAKTRRALGRAHLPPTKVYRRLTKENHFKTTARCSGAPGFSRRKIPHSSAYAISEKAIRFQHPDYDPDRAQKLISSSMSRHLSIRNISSKSIHAFLSNLANRQTDTGKNMSEVNKRCNFFAPQCRMHKQQELEGHSVELMYLRQSCSHGSRWIKPF